MGASELWASRVIGIPKFCSSSKTRMRDVTRGFDSKLHTWNVNVLTTNSVYVWTLLHTFLSTCPLVCERSKRHLKLGSHSRRGIRSFCAASSLKKTRSCFFLSTLPLFPVLSGWSALFYFGCAGCPAAPGKTSQSHRWPAPGFVNGGFLEVILVVVGILNIWTIFHLILYFYAILFFPLICIQIRLSKFSPLHEITSKTSIDEAWPTLHMKSSQKVGRAPAGAEYKSRGGVLSRTSSASERQLRNSKLQHQPFNTSILFYILVAPGPVPI